MCSFKSMIATQTEVLHDLDIDSHEELIKKYRLNDKTASPDFVRVEMLPKDKNIFNHARENWKLKIDQDFRPDWFCEEEAELAAWPYLEATFKARFVTAGTIAKIETGRWFVGGNAVIEYAYGNAVIESASGNAVIKSASGNAVIKSAYGNAVIVNISFKSVKFNLKEKAIAIFRYETPTRIVTAEKDAKLEIAEVSGEG